MSIGAALAARQGIACTTVPVSEVALRQAAELVRRKREAFGAGPELGVEMVVSVPGFLRDLRGMFQVRFETVWGVLQVHTLWKPQRCWDFPSCWFAESSGKITGAYGDETGVWNDLLGSWVLERVVEAAYCKVTGTSGLMKPMFHAPEVDPFTCPCEWPERR